MPFTRLPMLAQIAKEAGDIAASMQSDIVANKDWKVKEDGSIVTPADLEANRILCRRLAEQFSDVAILSEENRKESNAAALKARDRFETDPLDNTTGYAKGKDGWSVNIGRITDGAPVEGVIYFPAKRELYYTENGNAYLQKADASPIRIRARGLPLRDPLTVAVGFNEQNIEYLNGRPCETIAYPAQYRTCMVAAGQCDTTGLNQGANGGFNTYDIAGPHAVLCAAGGDIYMRDGTPFRYSDSIKVPDHFAAGRDTAVALNLAERLSSGRVKGNEKVRDG